MNTNPGGQRAKQSTSSANRGPVFYDAEVFELRVNGILVKRLDIRAKNQIAILSAFQEENWPRRIDDPLHPNGGDTHARLRSVVHCLNGHQHPGLIRFFVDGTGCGIRWTLIGPGGGRE